MNNVLLVGRISQTPQPTQRHTELTLAITRNFKNTNGEYETDFVPVYLYNTLATTTTTYTKVGDLIGVKGRLQTITTDDTTKLVVVADRITFLSTNTTEDNTQETNPLSKGEI